MLGAGVAPKVRQALGRLDRLAREQYLDFVHFRHFRESLLCHAGASAKFVLEPSRVTRLHVLAVARCATRRIAGERHDATGGGDRIRSNVTCSRAGRAAFRRGARRWAATRTGASERANGCTHIDESASPRCMQPAVWICARAGGRCRCGRRAAGSVRRSALDQPRARRDPEPLPRGVPLPGSARTQVAGAARWHADARRPLHRARWTACRSGGRS